MILVNRHRRNERSTRPRQTSQSTQRIDTVLEPSMLRYRRRVALVTEAQTVSFGRLWERAVAVQQLLDETNAPRMIQCAIAEPDRALTWVLGVIRSGRVVALMPDSKAPAAQLRCDTEAESVSVATDKGDLATDREIITDDGNGVALLRLPIAAEAGSSLELPSNAAVLLFTSGTTGAAKVVIHSHESMISSARRLRELQDEFFSGGLMPTLSRVRKLLGENRRLLFAGLRPQRWMTTFGVSTISGLSLTLQSILSGHTIVLTQRTHPGDIFRLIEAESVSMFATVPAVLRAMVSSKLIGEYDLSGLAVIGVGGGMVTPTLASQARERLRCEVAIGYGSTELGGGVLVTRPYGELASRLRTVGRPFPNVSVSIRDASGDECETGAPGELWCRSPGQMLGYLGRDAAPSGQGLNDWFRTSDRAVRETDGSIRIIGRSDDVIVRGGRKIPPEDIEMAVMTSCAVADAAAAGIRGSNGEDQIHLWVVPKGASNIEARLIMRKLSLDAPECVPQFVHVVRDLPMTADGKVKRHELVASLQRDEPVGPGSI